MDRMSQSKTASNGQGTFIVADYPRIYKRRAIRNDCDIGFHLSKYKPPPHNEAGQTAYQLA